MCFIKKSVTEVETSTIQEPVERKKADASITKSSLTNSRQSINQNIKTGPRGDETTAETGKKTLLGE